MDILQYNRDMNNPKKFFHMISYLQYPLILVALVFYVPFVMSLLNKAVDWSYLNYSLILLGVALSFSTLQDTTTTQNELSKKIWQDPKKGQRMLYLVAVMALLFMLAGFLFLFVLPIKGAEDVAVGLIVLGIGFIGILKAAIEMFENHRLDKNG